MLPIEITDIIFERKPRPLGRLHMYWRNHPYKECCAHFHDWWKASYHSEFSNRDCFDYIAVHTLDHFQYVLEHKNGCTIMWERIGPIDALWSIKLYVPAKEEQ